MSKGLCGAKNFLQIMCATSAAAAVIGRRLQCECAWRCTGVDWHNPSPRPRHSPAAMIRSH